MTSPRSAFRPRSLSRRLACWVALAALGACAAQESPAERITRQRARYRVAVAGWVVAQPAAQQAFVAPQPIVESLVVPAVGAPPPGAPTPGAPTPGAPAAAPDGEAEAAGVLVDMPPAVSDVELELEVAIDPQGGKAGDAGLPGLTVEVALADGAGKEKARYRVWLDTSAVGPEGSTKLAYKLQEVPYTPGDVLTAMVRADVPKSEWPMYKEFPAAAP